MERRRAYLPVLPDRVLIRPLARQVARATRPALRAVPTIVRRTVRAVARR